MGRDGPGRQSHHYRQRDSRATRGNDSFRTYSPGYDALVPRLLEKGVQIEVKPERSSAWGPSLPSWAPLLAFAWVFPIAVLVVAVSLLRQVRRIEAKLDRLFPDGGDGRGSG